MTKMTKILIVEAFRIARSILKQMLENRGFNVIAPSSAEQIMLAVSQDNIDFIIIDLDTEKSASWNFLKKITSASDAEIPCIGIAKNVSDNLIKRCKKEQLAACIKKPATAEEIAAIIHKTQKNKTNAFLPAQKSELSSMNITEAFAAIEKLGKEKDGEAICKLFRYLDDPKGDEALIPFVSDIVKQILNNNINFLLFGLFAGGLKTINLCASIAEKNRLKQAAPLLLKHIKATKDTTTLHRIIPAFKKIEFPAIVPILEEYAQDQNTMISLAAISALTGQNRDAANPILVKCLEHDEEIIAYAAAEALGTTGGKNAVTSLTKHIHHLSPQIRKAVSSSLKKIGSDAVTWLCDKLDSSIDDEIIMAAGILGEISNDSATDPLAKASTHANQNIRFAVFEALGKIGSDRAVKKLISGTADHDYSVVCAAVQGLDNNARDIHHDLTLQMESKKEIRENIISAISDMKAINLFNSLCSSSTIIIDIITQIKKSKNKDTILSFLESCGKIDKEAARKGAEMMLNKALKNLPEIEARILAVDDSNAILKFYQSVLSKANFHVVTAQDGEDAMKKFNIDNSFDLIITDMNMPNKNGIELTRYIRKSSSSDIPIILVTTESDKSQKDQAIEAGINHFLTKPVSKVLLQETARNFCGLNILKKQ
ncbi:MAG: response regulator [Thermodesulfobacteriota bacterium]|nr:response regulator [Thermodesulfobacteriota bacterium]